MTPLCIFPIYACDKWRPLGNIARFTFESALKSWEYNCDFQVCMPVPDWMHHWSVKDVWKVLIAHRMLTRVRLCIFIQEGGSLDWNLLHLTSPITMGQDSRVWTCFAWNVAINLQIFLFWVVPQYQWDSWAKHTLLFSLSTWGSLDCNSNPDTLLLCTGWYTKPSRSLKESPFIFPFLEPQ